MSFNGSGTFQLNSGGLPYVTGTTISSTTANNLNTDLASGLSNVICKDGQTTVTANLPMGTFRHTNVGAATARTDYARTSQVQDSTILLIGSISGTNTITGSLTPAITAYAAGQSFSFIPANTNTAATTISINSVGAANIFSGGVSLRGGELVAGVPVVIEYDGTQFNLVASGAIPPMVDPLVCDGRLTLTSGTAVTTSDVTAAETVYFTPYKGNKIALYTGSTWKLYTFAEVSGDVPDAAQMNDVFIYDNAGTLTLDVTAWTNTTTRATALALQDGVLVKSGAVTRRYLGSFLSTTAGNGQTEDSVTNRLLWNYYNRVLRYGYAGFTAVRTTLSTTWTELNTEIRTQFVVGVAEDRVILLVSGLVSNDTAGSTTFTSLSIDSTTVPLDSMTGMQAYTNSATGPLSVQVGTTPSIGSHFATVLGCVSGNTGGWVGAAFPGTSTRANRTVMTIQVQA